MTIKINRGPYAHGGIYTPGRKEPTIKYIVIHFTANDGDSDEGNAKYFADTARAIRDASAHYFVDADSITQSVRDEDTAWHCGTKGNYYHNHCRNHNSLGIEMCSRKTEGGHYYIPVGTIQNTIELVAYLMKKYDIPLKNVVRHYDVTHKICPEPFVTNTSLWKTFMRDVKEATTMKDVPSGDNPSNWAYKATRKAIKKGVFKGDGQGNYDWQRPLTREALAAILDNMGLLD